MRRQVKLDLLLTLVDVLGSDSSIRWTVATILGSAFSLDGGPLVARPRAGVRRSNSAHAARR